MRIHVPKSQRSDCVTVRHDGLMNSLREQMNQPESVPSGTAQVKKRLRQPLRSGPIAHPAPLPLFAGGSRPHPVRIFSATSEAIRDALWNATSDCLTEGRRQWFLLELPAEAKVGAARCGQGVARRRGWRLTPPS